MNQRTIYDVTCDMETAIGQLQYAKSFLLKGAPFTARTCTRNALKTVRALIEDWPDEITKG